MNKHNEPLLMQKYKYPFRFLPHISISPPVGFYKYPEGDKLIMNGNQHTLNPDRTKGPQADGQDSSR